MLSRVRSGLTYANVMATVAVFLALGGGAYAATKLPKNSVGTKQLKDGAVTEPKIRDGAVTGPKIANGAITSSKITNGAVMNPTIADNAVGSGKVADHSLLARDLAPGAAGPRQFDLHAKENQELDLPEVDGLVLEIVCYSASVGGGSYASATFRAHSSSQSVGLSGIGSFNGQFQTLNAQNQGSTSVFSGYNYSGSTSANFDVLARDVESPNKWTHWVIGLYNDGSAQGCHIWGNVDPPSN